MKWYARENNGRVGIDMNDLHDFSDEHLALLGAALGFTPDDLAANRRGYLAPRQTRRRWEGATKDR